MAEPRTSWGGVGLGLALGVLAAYHQFKLPPVMPLLLERHGYDKLVAGGFMSIYALVGLLASALLGVGIQGRGLRPFIAGAAVCFLAGSLIFVAWPAYGPLALVARGLEGLAFAALAVIGPVLTIGSASPRHAPIAVGIYATWIPLGQLIALGVALPVVGAEAWRPLWWVGIALTVIIAAFAWWVASPTGGGHEMTGPSQPVRAAPPRPSAAERRALFLTAGIFTLWSTQMYALLTWLPQYLVEVWALDPDEAALPYGIPPLLILVFNLVGGFLLRQGWPLAPLLAGALVLQAVTWLGLPVADHRAIGLCLLVLFGIGGGITPTCLFAAPRQILGAEANAGRAFGIVMTGRNIGVFAGPILLPPLLVALGGWAPVGPVFGGIALAGALGAGALALVLSTLARR